MEFWPHSPPHRNITPCTCMVTAATCNKKQIFNSDIKLNLLRNILFETVTNYNVNLEAWALLSNHYHLVLSTKENDVLGKFIKSFHAKTAIEINKIDNYKGRKIWFNYWDSKITFQNSYFARLNYVNKNPEYHGIVRSAIEYPWCSYAYYNNELDTAFVKTVNSFKIDSLNILDDF